MPLLVQRVRGIRIRLALTGIGRLIRIRRSGCRSGIAIRRWIGLPLLVGGVRGIRIRLALWDREVDSDRAPDSGTDSADGDRHSECSDKHWPVGPAEDIDSEDRRNIRGLRPVDWDRPDYWNKDFLVALDSGTGYPDREHSRRIAAAGFDRDHRLVESSPLRRDIPGKGDSLGPSGNPDWDTRVVDTRLFVRKDWS